MKKIKKILKYFRKKPEENTNAAAKKTQLKHAGILLLILIFMGAFYRMSAAEQQKPATKQEDAAFDGAFDSVFNQNSDEALIEKQQHQIDELDDAVKRNEMTSEKVLKVQAQETATKEALAAIQDKLQSLENENKAMREQLQVTILQNSQVHHEEAIRPPTREEMEAKLKEKRLREREIVAHAGLETVHFRSRNKHNRTEHNSKNYVWAGTFAEGVLLTGILGDAGINGSKNMGTALIRLTSNGIMPNDKRSHLEGCSALVSTFGDLSGSSVVLHLETLSCASHSINFEQKVYGAVYDLDAMQDLRGTSILKTKPLLSYTAAAGALAGFGDGLKNYGLQQTVNPGAGTITMFGTGQAIAQSAAGGALTNPANRISDYVMRIADLYHPLVVAKAGRRVSVLFTKGFWIDKEHQVYESGKAIDDSHELQEPSVTTIISQANDSQVNDTMQAGNNLALQKMGASGLNSEDINHGEQDFLQQQRTSNLPSFSTLNNGEPPHG